MSLCCGTSFANAISIYDFMSFTQKNTHSLILLNTIDYDCLDGV